MLLVHIHPRWICATVTSSQKLTLLFAAGEFSHFTDILGESVELLSTAGNELILLSASA